ncbi:TetR/AcrR family transcriptional regulator [Mycobacteroides saopaulense]|uniref:TetR/AcrR family transcriptional regulator n=1 Tax=Mycobacteroides saopaulense TaxID=1578165 RepID=UPI000AE4899B|nr:TetR/AcrR family transcriptional regulator [Mycobacteroides saopaulense]
MPPVNTERRAALADVAITVLADRGLKGLTHRAVDAAAGEPVGTTSRYFRTREALLQGVAEQCAGRLAGQLDNAASIDIGTLSMEDLLDRLTLLVDQAITTNRARTLAMMELFLEGTRSAEVRPLLAAALDTVLPVLRALLEASGLRPTNRDVVRLYSTINGVVLTLLTHSAQALGLSAEATTGQFVRDTLAAELASVAS